MSAWENYLKNIYFDPSKGSSLSSADKLYDFVKQDGRFDISRQTIQKWLQRQEPYSLQKGARHTFQRTPIIVAGIDDQWSADHMDMQKFAHENNGFRYVLLVVDTFSKYFWLQPLHDKTGATVAKAFKQIFNEGRKPLNLRTDKGQEFRSQAVTSLMKSLGIRQLFAETEKKASVSERAIKSVKAKIYRYFMYKNSYKCIDKLQRFAGGYNKTHHRTIDMAPSDVTIDNEEDARISSYLSRLKNYKKQAYRFKIGDRIRISHLRKTFSREYDQSFSGEIFTISQRFRRNIVPIYRLKDYDGDDITGGFYQQELQKVDLKDDELFKIESILKTKGKGQNKQYFVKWLYWPMKFNSWIKASDIEQI